MFVFFSRFPVKAQLCVFLLVSAASPSVMAAGVTGSVSVALHPLVILNISDHWTRIRSQEGRPMQGMRNYSLAYDYARIYLAHVGKHLYLQGQQKFV